ncbi:MULTISPECIES: hypothetical protein [unclassified Clostridium]|uniref:hypothetical protein n=1 Tax=Clostridium TaxID=1485 RepID=UPI001C8CEFF5|nr:MULTISPECIES: hypothetical protein [unclassified Clostridium]MBX9136454.1 hypothetical protein [Clostridium sp. K12(2020)]MBX9143065.1 hypothetical protein [Clostridium sp. K13]MDU2289747.1 hypothetical protein [Clostridium celatum]
MRKTIKYLLLCIVTIGVLVGCSNSSKEENVESFIKKLVSYNTYNNMASIEEAGQLIEDYKSRFGEYLTEDAFDLLMANRIFSKYSAVISDASGVTDINIIKTSETQNDGYIHFEYEVSYKLERDGETVDMNDYMAFNVLDEKGYKIEKVSILDKTSSIFKEFKK